MALPVLADHGVIADGWMSVFPGLDAERIASVFLVFLALLPATLVVTWAADGRVGLRDLRDRMFRWRIGAGWWLVVLTGLPVLTLAFAVALGDTFKPVDLVPFVATQVAGLLVNLVLDQHHRGDRVGRARPDPSAAQARQGRRGRAHSGAVRAGPHAAALHR